MNKIKLNLLLLSLILIANVASAIELAEGYPQTDRTKELINADWRFHLGDPDAEFYKTSLNDKTWEVVSVPHTLELTDMNINDYKDDKTQQTFQRNVGWYRKDIFVGKSDKEVYLDFEGVHQVTTLWVNGRKVGVHSVGGYTPFYFEITDYVKRGAKNQITILADNRRNMTTPPDPGPFDYIKFSGLYRDLYLVEKSKIHITSNLDSPLSGVTITTPSVDYINGNATIDIRTQIANNSKRSQNITLVQRVVDDRGNVVLKMGEKATVAAGERHQFIQTGGVDEDVKFWSIERPYLYKVNTTLYGEDGRAIDVIDNRLGLRKVEYDHETGFKLNGKTIEIVGLNRHQHYGFLGDAVPNSLHYKDVLQLKQWGFNCLRTAHYPQDDELIKACDELGILVYEEAPTWIDISRHEEWFENEHKAAQAMIRNHKNSPSIIIWGGGLNHRGAISEMHFIAKQEDPTRFTSSQSSCWTGWQSSSWADIFANMDYGPSPWGREEPFLAMEGFWGPEVMAGYFRDPMKPGMISWTAHAYYTFHDFAGAGTPEERTFWGLFDAFRYPKDRELFWYPSEMRAKPYIHLRDSWTPELKMLTIYSNATEVELFVNGKSQGRYAASTALKYNGLSHAPFEIDDFQYEDGELKVVGYREGEFMAQEVVHTPSKAVQLNLFADTYDLDFVADGNDIMPIHAEVLDKNGMQIKDFDGQIKFTITEGDATIVGDDIGEGFNPIKVYRGVGNGLVRAGKSVGKITVSASCDGLRSASIELETVAAECCMMAKNSYKIIDTETTRIDIGGTNHLCQFGWTAWDSMEQNEASISIAPAQLAAFVASNTPPASDAIKVVADGTKGAYKLSIRAASDNGILRWLGEINAIGRNNYVFGDGVLCADKSGLILTLSNLPAGKYSIKSYHHAPKSNTNDMDPNLERLKTESIHKLPYSRVFSVWLNGKLYERGIEISAGSDLQYGEISQSKVYFTVQNEGDAVEVKFTGDDNSAGVWLNGLELVRYL